MWFVRFISLGLLSAMVAVIGLLMTRRSKLPALFENRAANLLLVISYCSLCLLMAGLPSDPQVFPAPAFFQEAAARSLYRVAGSILIGVSVLIWIGAVRQRKALGGQDVEAGLLTTGLYRHFRHPIYVAIVWASLGVSLLLGTWDGLLMIPFVLLLNAVEAHLEERCDVGVRFAEQYAAYRNRTRMFGSFWIWAFLAGVLTAVPLAAHLLG
jgi:protein-S-isoprenylcysteine O-methyltransferase Ste14